MKIYYKTFINSQGEYTHCDFLTEKEAQAMPSSKNYVVTNKPIFFSEEQCESMVLRFTKEFNLTTFSCVKSFLRCQRPELYPLITNSSICSILNTNKDIDDMLGISTPQKKVIHYVKKK